MKVSIARSLAAAVDESTLQRMGLRKIEAVDIADVWRDGEVVCTPFCGHTFRRTVPSVLDRQSFGEWLDGMRGAYRCFCVPYDPDEIRENAARAAAEVVRKFTAHADAIWAAAYVHAWATTRSAGDAVAFADEAVRAYAGSLA